MAVMILVRGLPGSGKSTYAKRVAANLNESYVQRGEGEARVFEADQFFTAEDGTYTYDRSKVKEAHEDCQRRVREFIEAGGTDAIVANTFTREWEVAPYRQIAEETGSMLFIIRVEASYDNVHGVPREKIEEMASRFEDIPGEVSTSRLLHTPYEFL